MASAFGHSLVAFALVRGAGSHFQRARLTFVAALSSIVPDADVLSFRLGIPYSHALGHRGWSHSISFALLWSLLITFTLFTKGRARVFLVILGSALSHGILDAMTNGGLGVGFLIPFQNERFFFAYRPIEVSPIRISRFFEQAGPILLNELIWIGLPCIVLLLMQKFLSPIFKK